MEATNQRKAIGRLKFCTLTPNKILLSTPEVAIPSAGIGGGTMGAMRAFFCSNGGIAPIQMEFYIHSGLAMLYVPNYEYSMLRV